jgi:hypothetical protein
MKHPNRMMKVRDVLRNDSCGTDELVAVGPSPTNEG